MEKTENRTTLILFLMTALLFLPTLGMKDFYTRGEAREAMVAQGMIQDGEWILPLIYNMGVPGKPPMLHWLVSAVSIPAGAVSEFTSRLPSALGSIIFILLFERFLRRRVDPAIAFISAAILFLSPEWFRASQTCRVDIFLSVTLAGGLLTLYDWLEKDLKGVPLLQIALITAATLTKGPVALVLSGAIFGLYALRTGIPFFRVLGKSLLFLVPSLLLALVWYYLAYQVGGEKFWEKVHYENVQRFLSTMEDEPHKHSMFYIIGTLFIGLIPWVFYWLCGVLGRPRIKEWYSKLRSGREGFYTYSVISAFIITAFFCIPSSKRSTYLLPAYPFYAFLISAFLVSLSEKRKKAAYIAHLSLLVFFAIFICTIIVMSVYGGTLGSREQFILEGYRNSSLAWWWVFTALFAVFIITSIAFERARKNSTTHTFRYAVASLYALFFLLSNALIVPAANSLSPKKFALENQKLLEGAPRVFSYRDEFYAVSFYTDVQIYNLEGPPPSGSIVILYEKYLDEVKSVISKQQNITVVARSAGGIVQPGKYAVFIRIDGEA